MRDLSRTLGYRVLEYYSPEVGIAPANIIGPNRGRRHSYE